MRTLRILLHAMLVTRIPIVILMVGLFMLFTPQGEDIILSMPSEISVLWSFLTLPIWLLFASLILGFVDLVLVANIVKHKIPLSGLCL